MAQASLGRYSDRMHLVDESMETKCGIKVNSCNYEELVLTHGEEIFLKHHDTCAECCAEILKEMMVGEHLGG